MVSSSHDWTTPDYWDDYITQSTHAVREVTRRAVRYLGNDGAAVNNPRRALDLGAGKGIDALFLLQERFIVDAVDFNVAALQRLGSTNPGLTIYEMKIEDFAFLPETYTLITAHFSLPFLALSQCSAVIEGVKGSLKYGGVFAGTLFGMRDAWCLRQGKTPMTFAASATEVTDVYLRGLEILFFSEREGDGFSDMGTKEKRHIYHFVALKKRQ